MFSTHQKMVIGEVIISKYIRVSNQHIVHLNLHNVTCQLYLNKAVGVGK